MILRAVTEDVAPLHRIQIVAKFERLELEYRLEAEIG